MDQEINFKRQMPANIDAEKSVLGGLIIDNTSMGIVASLVKTNDFYLRNHQTIYKSMEDLYDRTGVIDLVTLSDQLEAYDELENVGGIEYLIELTEVTPTSANIESYAKIVKDKSTLRQLIQAAERVSDLAYEEGDLVENIVDQSERMILDVGEGSDPTSFKPIAEVINEAYNTLIELSEQKTDVVGLGTGFRELDKLTTGFRGGQMIIIAARPGVGKTAFALNIAQNVAMNNEQPAKPVAIFNMEMNALDLVNRMICAQGNINATNLRTGQLTAEEWESFTVATNDLRQSPIYIDDTAGIRVSEIRAKCRRLKQEVPELGLVVIDYLQLIQGSGRENRQQEVSEISRQLKMLAMELDIPVIALSQLSRSVESRENKRPVLSDIRESGSIEQDADIVAFLYREDYYQKYGDDEEGFDDDLPDNTIEVILAKNRNGSMGVVNLLFKKEYNKFSSMSYRPEPY